MPFKVRECASSLARPGGRRRERLEYRMIFDGMFENGATTCAGGTRQTTTSSGAVSRTPSYLDATTRASACSGASNVMLGRHTVNNHLFGWHTVNNDKFRSGVTNNIVFGRDAANFSLLIILSRSPRSRCTDMRPFPRWTRRTPCNHQRRVLQHVRERCREQRHARAPRREQLTVRAVHGKQRQHR